MSNYDSQIGKFLLAALMLLSIFSLVVVTQSNNNAVDPIANNDVFNASVGNLVSQINSSTTSAQTSYAAFNSEQPQTNVISIVLFSIVSIGKSFSLMAFGFFNAIVSIPLYVLGIPATVYNLIYTWLIIIICVAAWLLYKVGG